jgi:hypothetical protein
MNTRSRSRAEREGRRTIQEERRIERRERLDSRESLGIPYNLRTTMGRRGFTSSRRIGRGSKGEKTFDVSKVAPVVLFPLTEEDNEVEKGGSEVMFICNHNEILLCEIIQLNSMTES